MAPPPPDGSRGYVATIRRLMQGVGHTVPCNTSRQAALQARWVGWVGTWAGSYMHTCIAFDSGLELHVCIVRYILLSYWFFPCMVARVLCRTLATASTSVPFTIAFIFIVAGFIRTQRVDHAFLNLPRTRARTTCIAICSKQRGQLMSVQDG
eukprot:SAG25_NODE_20_length_23237_cov_58.179229_25_plen_152_part_00